MRNGNSHWCWTSNSGRNGISCRSECRSNRTRCAGTRCAGTRCAGTRAAPYAIAGGAIVAGIVAAAVIVYMHTKSAPATPSTAAASTGAANAPAAADASADQYRWTGLTEDQIQAERSVKHLHVHAESAAEVVRSFCSLG